MKLKKVIIALLGLSLLQSTVFATTSKEAAVSIDGQFVDGSGKALTGGTAVFFRPEPAPPAPERYWRVPDVVRPLDSSGRFSVELPEGSYFIGAIQRRSGSRIGPPGEGDLFCIGTDRSGSKHPFTIRQGQRYDLGTICRAVPFKAKIRDASGITAIEGMVVDRQGNPLSDFLVFASLAAGTAARPVFVSEPTGKDGRFILRVHDGGTFYLKSRARSGVGMPAAGEPFGIHGDSVQAPIRVLKGERLPGVVVRLKQAAGKRDLPEFRPAGNDRSIQAGSP